ncbi:MAG: DUF3299 domain-containing protein [Maricaulaceae bacterium]
MIHFKSAISAIVLTSFLVACQPAAKQDIAVEAAKETPLAAEVQKTAATPQATPDSTVETLVWEDLMPDGEDQILEALYTKFYQDQEKQFLNQTSLLEAAKSSDNAQTDVINLIGEGSALDTMEQIGTYNVVTDLDGLTVRLPGYVVPLDFNASSEYNEFLLVPYFGACLHTPPPPPNQIVYVKTAKAAKIADINEPVWIEGVMKTGKFGSELGNSAYEVNLTKLEPYEY